MRVEITSARSPTEVLVATKAFFSGPEAYESAWLETEGEGHATFGTFRGNLAVAAFPDPEAEGRTRVRISSLREEGIVPRLVTYLRTIDEARPVVPEGRPSGAPDSGDEP